MPEYGAEAVPLRSRARKAVPQAGFDVCHAAPAIESEEFDAAPAAVLVGAEQDFSAAAMLDEIGCKLSGNERNPTSIVEAEAVLLRDRRRLAPGLGDLARVGGGHGDHQAFQRVIVTLVPTPTCESMENSFDRRRAPPRPRPRPEPDVKPSRRAC